MTVFEGVLPKIIKSMILSGKLSTCSKNAQGCKRKCWSILRTLSVLRDVVNQFFRDIVAQLIFSIRPLKSECPWGY